MGFFVYQNFVVSFGNGIVAIGTSSFPNDTFFPGIIPFFLPGYGASFLTEAGIYSQQLA